MEQKKITIVHYKSVREETALNIEKGEHDLPVWAFYSVGKEVPVCPVCHLEIKLNIAHGIYIGRCSAIRLSNGCTMPIHTECYFSINEPDYKMNHFNQAHTSAHL